MPVVRHNNVYIQQLKADIFEAYDAYHKVGTSQYSNQVYDMLVQLLYMSTYKTPRHDGERSLHYKQWCANMYRVYKRMIK